MAALLGIALLWKFTTVCAVSLPGPAPIPRFAARPATSGASQRLTTRLCQQKSAPILPSRPLAPCLVLCSAESGIGLLLAARRSEEHTSELQSRLHLVCRLLLEKKKKTQRSTTITSVPRPPSRLLVPCPLLHPHTLCR